MSAQGAPSADMIAVEGVSKSYGRNLVLNGIDLRVRRGETVAVIGENGAGKSTLAKLMSGVIRPDSGTIKVNGRVARLRSPRDAIRAGIGFIPQELAYFNDLTVAENIVAGAWTSSMGFTSLSVNIQTARRAAESFGIDIDLRTPMRELRTGDRQLVEIIKVLWRRASALILDEPTAALSNAESAKLFAVLRRLAAQHYAILYISHRMDEVFRFSDRVDVLRNGDLVASARTGDVSPSYLISQMLGKSFEDDKRSARPSPTVGAPRLSLRGWQAPGDPGLSDVSFDIREGEIVGMFGLRGSGADIVAEALGGVRSVADGVLEINGHVVRRPTSPRQALLSGIGYLPAERKRNGLVLPLSVRANISMMILRHFSRLGFVRPAQESKCAAEWTQRLKIRLRSINQPVAELSGGNQQKVMVASRIAAEPQILVLQEPTRGVDIGARDDVHKFISRVASSGVAVLLVTTDVDEAVRLCDRLLIIRNGCITTELSADMITQESALTFAAGDQP